jgi:GT2 family glycosyltransferase
MDPRSQLSDSSTAAITAVIVCYDEEAKQIRAAVDSLLAQTRPPSEIIVVDNGPAGRLAAAVRGYSPALTPLECPENLGYVALNRAALHASGDYIVCLNPDADAQPDCLEQLAAVADSDPRVGLVGAQILLEDGVTRNAGANPLHPTGISPSGGYGEPRESGQPRDVIIASGACFLVRTKLYRELGGFVEDFFLYYEDVDLSWRARIAGQRVVYCPWAVVSHSYEFGARPRKWFLLERNRLFSVLANYELRTLVLLAPLLLATEAGLIVVATRGGWITHKLRSYVALFRLRKRLKAHRLRVQASRRASDAQLMAFFDDRLDSALIPASSAALANFFCVPYMAVVRRFLR